MVNPTLAALSLDSYQMQGIQCMQSMQCIQKYLHYIPDTVAVPLFGKIASTVETEIEKCICCPSLVHQGTVTDVTDASTACYYLVHKVALLIIN